MRGIITVCLNHWVQDCATCKKSSPADCHGTPVSWCKVFACTGDLPSSCEELHPQIFLPSASPQANSDLLPGTLFPCKALQALGQATTSLQLTLGQPLKHVGPSWCSRASSLSGFWLSLGLETVRWKQKATNPLSYLITITSTLFFISVIFLLQLSSRMCHITLW